VRVPLATALPMRPSIRLFICDGSRRSEVDDPALLERLASMPSMAESRAVLSVALI
jgi:hypothetical protein